MEGWAIDVIPSYINMGDTKNSLAAKSSINHIIHMNSGPYPIPHTLVIMPSFNMFPNKSE